MDLLRDASSVRRLGLMEYESGCQQEAGVGEPEKNMLQGSWVVEWSVVHWVCHLSLELVQVGCSFVRVGRGLAWVLALI